MAIKGKGKTKTRGVAKPPRRAPVPVPVPFARKRWVQVTAAFLLGLGVFLFAVWVTNGLRTSKDADRAAKELTAQQEALQSWQAEVQAQIGKVGQFQDPQPPTVGAVIHGAVTDLQGDKQPTTTVDELTSYAASLGAAAKKIDAFAISDLISGKGFGQGANTIITANLQFVQSLHAYRTAALLTVLAMKTKDAGVRAELTDRAAETLDTADALLQDAHRGFLLGLSYAQISTTPSSGFPP